jgi:hypothetical protein
MELLDGRGRVRGTRHRDERGSARLAASIKDEFHVRNPATSAEVHAESLLR